MKIILFKYVPAWILLTILGLIVLHAPITVYVSSHWPGISDYVKAWKELLMVIAGALIVIDYSVSKCWRSVKSDKVLWLAGAFIGIHILSLLLPHDGLQSVMSGLMIDLRYVVYFVLVYLFLKRYPKYKPSFLKVGLIGAVIVVGFAFIQLFLPHDFLKYLGYGHSTIEPYMTVDNNLEYIRQNSTLRGPNPLGAYALMALIGVFAFVAKSRGLIRDRRKSLLAALFAILSATALSVSYSRGALIGTIVAVLIVILIAYQSKFTKLIGGYAILGLIVGLSGFYLIRDSNFVQNVVVHNNPTTGAAIDSNQGHLDSLQSGFDLMVKQPLGAGIGSTGSASLFSSHPIIIENQFLFVAHEVGWLGLAIFVGLIGAVLYQLWRKCDDWRYLAAFASGIGLLVVGLVLPVWVDDTVSIVWWGLAATLISTGGYRARTSNQKTA